MNVHTHTTLHNSITVVKRRASEVRTPAFDPGPKLTRHMLWANNVTALAPHSVICKPEMMKQITRIKCNNLCEPPTTVPGPSPA